MSLAAAPALALRRDFRFSAEDNAFLDRCPWRWDAIQQDGIRRLVFYGYSVPAGYHQKSADLFLRIESGYPDIQLDMVYFSPALSKVSGSEIKALSTEQFDGRTWQRWSRHRTPANPWRPGLDNVETHLALVNEWLEREVRP